MNAHTLALRAYSQTALPVRTPRASEYGIIAKISHAMRVAAMKGAKGFPELATALHDNRRLWTALAVDASDPDNELPPDLRARIVYLAEFTAVQTSKVLNGQASVRPLLEVNAAILRGLSTEKRPV